MKNSSLYEKKLKDTNREGYIRQPCTGGGVAVKCISMESNVVQMT